MGERTHGLGGVAALEVPGGAVGASVERDGVGGRKERKSGESDGEDASSEHHLVGKGASWAKDDCVVRPGVPPSSPRCFYVSWASLTSSFSSFKGSGRCR